MSRPSSAVPQSALSNAAQQLRELLEKSERHADQRNSHSDAFDDDLGDSAASAARASLQSMLEPASAISDTQDALLSVRAQMAARQFRMDQASQQSHQSSRPSSSRAVADEHAWTEVDDATKATLAKLHAMAASPPPVAAEPIKTSTSVMDGVKPGQYYASSRRGSYGSSVNQLPISTSQANSAVPSSSSSQQSTGPASTSSRRAKQATAPAAPFNPAPVKAAPAATLPSMIRGFATANATIDALSAMSSSTRPVSADESASASSARLLSRLAGSRPSSTGASVVPSLAPLLPSTMSSHPSPTAAAGTHSSSTSLLSGGRRSPSMRTLQAAAAAILNDESAPASHKAVVQALLPPSASRAKPPTISATIAPVAPSVPVSADRRTARVSARPPPSERTQPPADHASIPPSGSRASLSQTMPVQTMSSRSAAPSTRRSAAPLPSTSSSRQSSQRSAMNPPSEPSHSQRSEQRSTRVSSSQSTVRGDEHSEVDDLFELTRVRDELMLGSGIEPRDGAPLTERDQQRARLKALMAQTHEAERASVHMQHELESMQQRMSAIAATQRIVTGGTASDDDDDPELYADLDDQDLLDDTPRYHFNAATATATGALPAESEAHQRDRAELDAFLASLQNRTDDGGQPLVEFPSNYNALVTQMHSEQRQAPNEPMLVPTWAGTAMTPHDDDDLSSIASDELDDVPDEEQPDGEEDENLPSTKSSIIARQQAWEAQRSSREAEQELRRRRRDQARAQRAEVEAELNRIQSLDQRLLELSNGASSLNAARTGISGSASAATQPITSVMDAGALLDRLVKDGTVGTTAGMRKRQKRAAQKALAQKPVAPVAEPQPLAQVRPVAGARGVKLAPAEEARVDEILALPELDPAACLPDSDAVLPPIRVVPGAGYWPGEESLQRLADIERALADYRQGNASTTDDEVSDDGSNKKESEQDVLQALATRSSMWNTEDEGLSALLGVSPATFGSPVKSPTHQKPHSAAQQPKQSILIPPSQARKSNFGPAAAFASAAASAAPQPVSAQAPVADDFLKAVRAERELERRAAEVEAKLERLQRKRVEQLSALHNALQGAGYDPSDDHIPLRPDDIARMVATASAELARVERRRQRRRAAAGAAASVVSPAPSVSHRPYSAISTNLSEQYEAFKSARQALPPSALEAGSDSDAELATDDVDISDTEFDQEDEADRANVEHLISAARARMAAALGQPKTAASTTVSENTSDREFGSDN